MTGWEGGSYTIRAQVTVPDKVRMFTSKHEQHLYHSEQLEIFRHTSEKRLDIIARSNASFLRHKAEDLWKLPIEITPFIDRFKYFHGFLLLQRLRLLCYEVSKTAIFRDKRLLEDVFLIYFLTD